MNVDPETALAALIFGTFLAESAKNVAKGSANWIADNGKSLFYTEFTALGLSESASSDEIVKQLEANPGIINAVEQKIEASPDFVKELFEKVKAGVQINQSAKNITNAKNVGTIINDSHAPINITNKFS